MYNLCVTMDICAVLSYTPSSPLMSDLSDLWPLYVYSCFYKPTFLVSAKMYFCIPVKSISHVVLLLLPRYQIHLTCVLGSGSGRVLSRITGKLVLLLILNNLYSCKPDTQLLKIWFPMFSVHAVFEA